MLLIKLIICLSIVLITCCSITCITFYDEYKHNKVLPDDDPDKESTIALFCECFMTAMISTLFIAIPIIILLFIFFPND